MPDSAEIKVAVLIDLLRSPQSGGHVKGWERLAQAATRAGLPLDLTVYFCGAPLTESLSPRVTIRQLPQYFSTARLKFLPYLPDHTDLAPYHPPLARALADCDVVHTTDAFFAYSRTAERVKKRRGIGLTHSFHTDQPSYAKIFMTKAIRDIFSQTWVRNLLIERWRLPERKARQMERRCARHLALCDTVLATRPVDRAFAEQACGAARVRHLRLGVDKAMFNPGRACRAEIMKRYGIPEDRIIVMFVGRLDEGKNIHTLIAALAKLVRAGLPMHLVAAGIGPAADNIRSALPHHASVPGFVQPDALAKLYASADVMALTSEVEIRSMAMVESLACGLPVLVAAKSGIDQLFPATPAIAVVQGGSDSWAEALREFAVTQQHVMRTAAQHFAVNHIASWEDVLTQDLFPAWLAAAEKRTVNVSQ